MKAVCVVEKSGNSKVGRVSATYAPFQTCPESCPIKEFCYAKYGPISICTKQITEQAEGKSVIELAHMEAEGIRGLKGRLPLRLHVSGDCPNAESAAIVGEACYAYRYKHNQPVWTYTHAWRDVPRDAWGTGIAVLASCVELEEVSQAQSLGYVTAMVVPKLPKKAFKIGSTSFVPCREQKTGLQCVACKLCFKERLNRVIVFEAHGARKNRLAEFLS